MNKKNNKSILLIMPYGSVGGMERLALNFYEYYKELGYVIKALKFIKLSTDIIHFGEDELFFSERDLYEMTGKERGLFYLNTPFKIRKLIKQYKITHSIAFGDMANFFSSLSFTNEFKIGSIHALKSVELKNTTFFNKITKIGYRSSYKYLDKLVCISKAIKEDLKINCGYKFSNLEIIYNPHNIKDIVSLSKELITDKNEIEIFSKKTILFLGRLSIQKSPWHLIKAFSIVKEKYPDINLVLIGDGDIQVTNFIKELISDLELNNQVFLLGRKSNPYKYIAASNVLALSSNYEGTPNVIVESIAVGTPIVSSYCTKGIIELMSTEDHKETDKNISTESGVVTPNLFKGVLEIPKSKKLIKEERDFADALSLVLMDDSYKNNLKTSRSKLLSKFDLNAVANEYLQPMKN
ncbi:hypothetical protein GCM10022393_13790 [Aquimarina addita]|uniref:Glycosyltransferase n=1 Tax=Aquimarina addita TaxID=870485 RepID=A0ABP7XFJ5_9FLAO